MYSMGNKGSLVRYLCKISWPCAEDVLCTHTNKDLEKFYSKEVVRGLVHHFSNLLEHGKHYSRASHRADLGKCEKLMGGRRTSTLDQHRIISFFEKNGEIEFFQKLI